MSRHTAGRPGPRRRRARIALASALVLAAEAAFISGQTAVAAPDEPSAPTATASAKSPSRQEIWESDLAWAAEHAKGSTAWAIARAKKTGKKVVATDETTPTTYTVANPDGTLTTELTAGPERVWKNGAWQKADATLTEAADGSVVPKAHPGGLRLGGGSGTPPKSLRAAQDAPARDLVTLGSGDDEVALRWKGGLPKPELDGTRARYRNAVPGADVVVEATRTGFEQFVEIGERPTGAYSYTLPVRAKGLEAKANKDGSVTFTDAETGARRATMPAPVMWDSAVDKRSGEHTNRARVDMKVVPRGTGEVDLVVTPSAEFLADPRTKYPVTVDPSTSALSNTFDTYVQQGETVDWSNDTELDFGNPGTKNSDGTPRTARSFITWNTTPIQDALIVDTNLALWNFHSGNTDCVAQKWTVWDTGAPSTSSRWASQPDWKQEYHSSTQTKGNPDCAATQPDGWINADVDTLVQSWASAKATRGHMGLRAATDDIKAWKRVNSANNTANQPKLSVTYNYRPSDGTNRQAGAPFKSYAGVWAVNTTTPTLRDTFTDPDGDKVNGTFQVYDAATDTPITTPSSEGLIVSDFVDSGKPASVTVPAGQLKDGRTYKFRTNAYDGTHYNLSWSPWTQFVVDTTAPAVPSSVTSSTYTEDWVGGGAGITGTFDVTASNDANTVRVRLDGTDTDDDDVPDSGTFTTVGTTPAGTGTTAAVAVTPAEDGAHELEVQAVDRAANVGPVLPYGFIAGGADVTRPHKVEINLPTPVANAPEPTYSNDPMPAFGWGGWENSPLAAAARDAGLTEPRTYSENGTTLKVTPLKQRTKAAADSLKRIDAEDGVLRKSRSGLAASAAAGYTGPVITGSWCDPTLTAQKSFVTRDEACLLYKWEVEVLDNATSPPKIYHQEYELMWQIKLDREGDEIKQWVQMTPVFGSSAPYLPFPAQPGAINIAMSTKCPGTACTEADGDTGFDWESGRNPSWAGSLDSDLAQGNATVKWNGSVPDAASTKDADLSKELPLSVYGYFSSQLPGISVPTQPHLSTPAFTARCDKAKLSTTKAPGCVFPYYVPGYAINSAKAPAAAAHAWLMQQKMPGHYGRDPLSPLRYLPNQARNAPNIVPDKSNRKVICPRTGKGKFVKHPQTGEFPELISTGGNDTKSCDEYAFNATYQSGGMPANLGGTNPVGELRGAECVQTYATRTQLLNDLRYADPTWSEVCGRSSMSGWVNSGAMNRFGSTFVPEFRMLDKDYYWVDIKGLDDCDASGATVKCTLKP